MSKVLIIEEKRLLRKADKDRLEKEYEDKTGMKCVVIDGGAKTYVVDEEIRSGNIRQKDDVVFNLSMIAKDIKGITDENIQKVLNPYNGRRDISITARRMHFIVHGINAIEINAESNDCYLLLQLQKDLMYCYEEWETSSTYSPHKKTL